MLHKTEASLPHAWFKFSMGFTFNKLEGSNSVQWMKEIYSGI